MQKLIHQPETIATLDPAWGNVYMLYPSADNRSVAIVTIMPGAGNEDGGMNIIFKGKIVAEYPPIYPPNFALSPTGNKLATAAPRADRRHGSVIRINGETAYETKHDVYHLSWLDEGRLAWILITPRKLKYFVNGKDTTGEIEFESAFGNFPRTEVVVWEAGICSVRRDDGTRQTEWTVHYKNWRDSWINRVAPPREEMPEIVRFSEENGKEKQKIVWRGRDYPPVDLIDTGAWGGFAFSPDGSRLGYIEIRQSRVAEKVSQAIMGAFSLNRATQNLAGESDDETPHPSRVRVTGRKLLATAAEGLLAVPMVASALLFNPYFGPLYGLEKSLKRSIPVDDGLPWSKAYPHAGSAFYTPDNKLVATATDRRGRQRVVINEEEGPLSRSVLNARCLGTEGNICYCARQGDEILRVVVNN